MQTRKARAVETRRSLDQLRAELSRLKARKDSTQDILSHRTYTTESVKRLFTAVEKGRTKEIAPLGSEVSRERRRTACRPKSD